MTNTPRVSIGLPVYNGENYLAETLDCFLNQTYGDFELVIVDNASTDTTPEICQSYADRDGRIRYHRNESNIGAVRNYNKAFELSKAPYFKWAAHDDVYEPTYLEKCVAVLDQSPDVVLVHCAARMIGPAGELITFDRENDVFVDRELEITKKAEAKDLAEVTRPEDRFRDILMRAHWCTSIFGVIRREDLSRTSLHEPYYGSDKVLLSELALMGRFYHVREELFSKRCHREMSHFKGTKEKAAWINPNKRQVFAPVHLLFGYVHAARNFGALKPAQRASCLLSVFLKFVRAGFWKRLLVFGPHHPVPLPSFTRK